MANTNKYGEQDWADVKVSGDKEKVDFMRLNEGSNVVRILTLPHAYYQHRFTPEGGKKYGYRISCSDPEHRTDCPLCELGNKPVRKWFLGVIDRKSNAYKVLDIGFSIFKDIQKYARDEDWGPDVSQFDMDIVNDPSAGPQRYSCVCKPKKPLSASDLQIKEEHPTDVLVVKSAPPSRDSVQGYFDHILEELKASGNPFTGSATTASGDSGKSDDEDTDTFFKDYDKK